MRRSTLSWIDWRYAQAGASRGGCDTAPRCCGPRQVGTSACPRAFEHPDVVLSSTMRRAVETAEIIAEGLAVPVQTLEGLCERTPGECEGMTHDEYRARYGRDPWSDWVRPLSPGGESDEEFVARVRGVIGGLAEAHRGQTAWLVCHGGIIMATAAFLMQAGGGIDTPRWENPAPSAISEWTRSTNDKTDGPWTLRRYNDHAHLVI